MSCIIQCLHEANRLDTKDQPEICETLQEKLFKIADGLMFANIHELLPNKEDPEGDSNRCILVVGTMAALLQIAYTNEGDSHGGDLLNLTGVAATQALNRRAKRNLRVLSLFGRMLRVAEAIPSQQSGKGKKPATGKKDGKKHGGGNRIQTMMAMLSKYSQTHFIDLSFVDLFVDELLTAANGEGNEKLTRTERDHDHLLGLLNFLLHSAAKFHFVDNRRLTESAYKLGRTCLQVITRQVSGLNDDQNFLYAGSMEFLLSAVKQVNEVSANKFLPVGLNKAKFASMRDLLLELNLEGNEENELKLSALDCFYELLNNVVVGDGDNPTTDNREVVVFLSLIKLISQNQNSSENDERELDEGDSDLNLTPALEKACDQIEKLCRDSEIGKPACARHCFEFLLECSYRSNRKFRSFLAEVSEDTAKKIGKCEDEDESTVSPIPAKGVLSCITSGNAMQCAVVPMLHHVEEEIGDVNFVLELIRLWLLGTGEDPNVSINPRNPGQKIPKIRDIFWRQVFEHQYSLVKSMKSNISFFFL